MVNYCLYCYNPMLYNVLELHNSSMFTIALSCTIRHCCTMIYIIISPLIHSLQLHSLHLIKQMEPPSRTTSFLDILFTPPVYKTYIFHQDFSSRDNLMHSIKVTP